MTQETWVLIIKYTASASAACYGVYATLNDFHDEKDGRKVLARAGYFGIAFLVLTSILGICSDVFKDSKDHRKDIEDDVKRVQLLSGEIAISNKLQSQIDVSNKIATNVDASVIGLQNEMLATNAVMLTAQRATMPLPKDILTTIKLELPAKQPQLAEYMELLNSRPASYPNKGPQQYIDRISTPEAMPVETKSSGEKNLSALFSKTYFDVLILDSPPGRTSRSLEDKSELHFLGDCSEDSLKHHPSNIGPFRPASSDMVYDPPLNRLSIECWSLPASEIRRNGSFSSMLDFAGKYVWIRVGQYHPISGAGKAGALLQASDLLFSVQSLQFTASLSTRLTIIGFKRQITYADFGKSTMPVVSFVARIPNNARWDK